MHWFVRSLSGHLDYSKEGDWDLTVLASYSATQCATENKNNW